MIFYIILLLQDLVCEENEQFLKNLRAVEDKWGIYINIFEEWEKTFDTLLDYYNTKDLRSTCKSIFLHNKALRKTNKLLSVHELSKWMKPQMEPSIWKKWLGQVSLKWKEHYEKEQKCYEKQYKSLTEIFKGKKNVSKKDVMCAIIEELRKGKKNKEVHIVMFPNLCVTLFYPMQSFFLTFNFILLCLLGNSFSEESTLSVGACRVLQIVAPKIIYRWSYDVPNVTILLP